MSSILQTVYYDWSCDGSASSALSTFHSGFTFTTSDGGSGTWSQADNQVVWTFTSGTQYTSYIAGNSMTGTIRSCSGAPGCLGSRAGHCRLGGIGRCTGGRDRVRCARLRTRRAGDTRRGV